MGKAGGVSFVLNASITLWSGEEVIVFENKLIIAERLVANERQKKTQFFRRFKLTCVNVMYIVRVKFTFFLEVNFKVGCV